jgi:hypothetical protein
MSSIKRSAADAIKYLPLAEREQIVRDQDRALRSWAVSNPELQAEIDAFRAP